MAKKAQLDAVRPVLNALDAEATAVEKVLDAVEAGTDKATDVLESGLEKVADVVPEAIDKSVNVTAEVTRKGVRALRDPRKVAVVIGLSFVAAGVVAGVLVYRNARRRLEKEFEDRLDAEIDSMRDFYIQRYKAGQYVTPETAAEALGATKEEVEVKEAAQALDSYQRGRTIVDKKNSSTESPVAYNKVKVATDTVLKGIEVTQDGTGVEVQEKDIVVERNVFVEGRPLVIEDWDAETEEANRNPEFPYVISHDEFMENSFEHEQITLTYYEGDDILAESDDSIINEVESIVGSDNLGRFGHGSRDSNTVYIRNERTESDYEVVRSKGKYAEEVHDLRHSDEPSRQRRSRWGDDE